MPIPFKSLCLFMYKVEASVFFGYTLLKIYFVSDVKYVRLVINNKQFRLISTHISGKLIR